VLPPLPLSLASPDAGKSDGKSEADMESES